MSPELAILIEKCLAGEADEAEMASMMEQIHASDEAYREYLEQVNFLLDMRDLSPDAITANPSPQPPRKLQSRRPEGAKLNSWWLAAAAATLLAGILVLTLAKPAPAPAIAAKPVQPEIPAAPMTSPWSPVAPLALQVYRQGTLVATSELQPGDRLVATGKQQLRLADGSSLRLDSGTEIILPLAASPMRLLKGDLKAKIKPQPSPLLINTADAGIEVLGTVFSLRHVDASTLLQVEHGCVAMFKDGFRQLVSTGSSLSSRELIEEGRTSEVLLQAYSSDWRFFDRGEAPPGWTELGFDDSSWTLGQAPLGYGETCRSHVAVGKITYYFRRSFEVAEPEKFSSLILKMIVDDGALLRLNGSELLRVYLPEGEISPETLAKDHEARRWHRYKIPAKFLRPGKNLLSVEVHNRATDSSDIFLDLELHGRFVQP